MRAFRCDICGQLLVFENSVCVRCGTAQAFDVLARRFVPAPGAAGGPHPCANRDLAGCNWLAEDPGALCLSCRLTRTRPNDADQPALVAFGRTEAAKRRLVYQLLDLGLPVVPKSEDEARGMAFDLLSSAQAPVLTGHVDGVVTIDLAEGHDVHREAMRVELAEPYRTLLGHVRHEIGHYYWTVLVAGNGLVPTTGETVARFRELFGDERADYGEALQRHYAEGAPSGWSERYVSAYATAHPWEDWAETFAHYLHIRDTLQTAAAYGLVVTGPEQPVAGAAQLSAVPREHDLDDVGIQELIGTWLPLTYALNAVNRSMGSGDLYPFVLSPTVVSKLDVVHGLLSPSLRDHAPICRDHANSADHANNFA